MPLYLVPPRPGRSKFYRVRGTHLGVYIDRSTESAEKAAAQRLLAGWRRQIETGEIRGRGELTFDIAAGAYISAGGEDLFLGRIVAYLGTKILAREVTQTIVDQCAAKLYPNGSPATRNRQVYTPIKAVLAHAKIPAQISRPRGGFGQVRTCFLNFDQIRKVQIEATKIDPELGTLFLLVAYTGLRLGEALSLKPSGLDLENGRAFIGKTKNGEPREVRLVPVVVTALRTHPRGLNREKDRAIFDRWSFTRKHLYAAVRKAYAAAEIDHQGAPWHILRHSYGAAMTRLGADLVATKVWKSPAAARVYQHFQHNEEAEKAVMLPGAKG